MHETILFTILVGVGLGTFASFVKSKYTKIKNAIISKKSQDKTDIEWT
jgi:hypothetical protein